MHYLHFKQRGIVEIHRRPDADTFYTPRWHFDEQRQQPYIVVMEEDKRKGDEAERNMLVGNRLYLNYDMDKKIVEMGDIRPLSQFTGCVLPLRY